MTDSDLLKEAQEAFKECEDNDSDNHRAFAEDVKFARMIEHWPEELRRQREDEGRPCLAFDRLGPVIRQVVNDARQNKPAITVRPQDSQADPATAEIMTGLVRNIESASDADVCYDTAVDNATSGGFGYFAINTRYACDDSWDQDIVFERIINPLSVHGDPFSIASDSSDWNLGFIVDRMSKKAFQKEFKGADEIDWESFGPWPSSWREGDQIMVAKYWTRTKVSRRLLDLRHPATEDRQIVAPDDEERGKRLVADGYEVTAERPVMSYEVKCHVLNGVEKLKTIDWAGRFIPIVPVYGDEVVVDGKRHFRSLIRGAKDPQKMYDFWRSQVAEMLAYQPKAPFMVEARTFDGLDEDETAKWDNANVKSYAYLMYANGSQMPQRMGFPTLPAGMMQEALTLADDIKAITGIHDASLGARSNETSGVAIRNRQMEGDTSTFHFIDNLSRSIRHAGRILIDLIPKVYNSERVIRILGEDGKAEGVQIGPTGQPVTETTDQNGAISRIYDLTVGKYDLSVEAGPSYTSRREETRAELVEIIRAVPESATVLGPMYLRNSDWPGAQDAADKLEQGQGGEQQGIPPEIQEQIGQGMAMIQELQAENAQLKQDQQIKAMELQIKAQEAEIKRYEAETRRMEAMKPDPQPVRPAAERQPYTAN